MTTVSVVIPAYNRAQWLHHAVCSALQQSHAPLEILVVDDGSTDDTPAVCAGFGPMVRHILQDHAGAAVARNRGLHEARGDYVAFLDSDDAWESRKLEMHLAIHEALPQVAWSISDCQFIDKEGRPLAPPQGFRRAYPVFRDLGVAPEQLFARKMTHLAVPAMGKSRSVFAGDAYELLFEGNFVTPQCTVLERALCARVGDFDPAMWVAQDTEYFHRVAAVSPVAIIMEPLVQWRIGLSEHNTAPRNTVQLVRNALTSVDRAATLRHPFTPAAEQAYRRGRHRLLLRLAYAQLSGLDRAAARATVRQAWRSGVPLSARSVGILGASLLPRAALRGLHAVKRSLAR